MKTRPPEKTYDPFVITDRVNDFWARTFAYARTKNSRIGQKKYYVVDGPPFTAGDFTIGFARNKLLKDVHVRFMKSQGFDVIDTPGFDMHGLPIEIKIEESLGITYKKQIEEMGVEKFINLCSDYANEHQKRMTEQFKSLGIWLNWNSPYLTADTQYIESVWWSLKEAYRKKMLEKQKQVTSWCPRCESPLAQGEINYREKKGHSVYFKIPIKGRRDEYIIVWTTNPWSFVGCMAIAVHPDLTYARVAIRQSGRKSTIIVLESRVEEIAAESGIEAYEIIESVKGKSLENLGFFHPLMADIPYHKTVEGERCHKIIALDSVHDSHTGSVYISPGFGLADSQIASQFSLPLFSPVDERGILTTEVGIKYAGQNIDEANASVVTDMNSLRFVLYNSMNTHKSPHCWRCSTPIIHRVTEQWFLKSKDLKDIMLKSLKSIAWVPESFGATRQHEWVMKANDWCISRQRYWGTPLPIWECITDVCGHVELVGSVRELEDANGYSEGMNLHRPWIDQISLECPKCGGLMKRVPDIVDVWFDSSVASWAQLGYPRKKNAFKNLWPGDWIAEGQEQSRGWFYNQIFSSVLLFNKVPFRKALAHGNILYGAADLADSGSQSPQTADAIGLYGPDAFRFYILGLDPCENVPFSPDHVKKAHNTLKILWNCYAFSASYMNMDGWDSKDTNFSKIRGDLRQEDLWLISKAESLTHDVKREMDAFRYHNACELIENFIVEDVSRWYIRLIRERIWVEGLSHEKTAMYTALRELFTRLSVVMSPFAPYLSETIYQEMNGSELSVSMVKWPETDATRLIEGLERSMKQARAIVRTSQIFRQELGLNLRWPIKKMTISASSEDVATAVKTFADIIKNQANVKEIELVPENQEWAGQELIVVPNPNVIGKAYKQRESKIARMLKVLPAKEIKAKIEAGEYSIGIEGELIKILPEMVRFETKLPEGVVSKEFGNGILYFDTNMDDSLLAEGFAREIIRRIQQMRKEMGLDPEEFIKLRVKMDEDLLDLLDKWLEKIADSTRATQMEVVEEIADDDYIVEWPIKEETVTIGVTSMNIRKAMNEFMGLKDIDREQALAIVEYGILTAQDFINSDRENLLKIPGMNHTKLRKLREYLELPKEQKVYDPETVCPLCHGYVEPGSSSCYRCGKDLVGGEDLVVEINSAIEAEEEPDYNVEPVREKVRIEKRKRQPETPAEPEDEIVKMASEGPASSKPEDMITSEIMDSIRVDLMPNEEPEEKHVEAAIEKTLRAVESEPAPKREAPHVDVNIQIEKPAEAELQKPVNSAASAIPEPPVSSEDETGDREDNVIEDPLTPEEERAIIQIADTFDIKQSSAKILYRNGFPSVESLTRVTEERLRGIKGIGKVTARRIVQKTSGEETKLCSLCNAIVLLSSPACPRCGTKFTSVDEHEARAVEKHITTMDMLEKKLQKKPSDSLLLHSKAMTLKDAGKVEEALIVVKDALLIAPDDDRLIETKKELESILDEKAKNPEKQPEKIKPAREEKPKKTEKDVAGEKPTEQEKSIQAVPPPTIIVMPAEPSDVKSEPSKEPPAADVNIKVSISSDSSQTAPAVITVEAPPEVIQETSQAEQPLEEPTSDAPQSDVEVEIRLKPSFTYLIPEERSAKSYRLFKMNLDKGMPGYCVTRTFPEKVRERYELGNIPILWLSNVAKEEAVRPKDLEKLSLSLEEFLGKEGGIILLDGIEYLITNNNFITVLKLIQSLRDQVAINRSIMLLSINPSTMDSHQINLLKREVDSVIE